MAKDGRERTDRKWSVQMVSLVQTVKTAQYKALRQSKRLHTMAGACSHFISWGISNR